MTETSDEVRLYDAMCWVERQAKYLSPAQHHVLWYLTLNAWRTTPNAEDARIGQVMSGKASCSKIRAGTGLSIRTILRALEDLQEQGYIIANMSRGRGLNHIHVFWGAAADDLREDVRTGIRDLPKDFQKPPKEVRERPSGDNIVDLHSRHRVTLDMTQ